MKLGGEPAEDIERIKQTRAVLDAKVLHCFINKPEVSLMSRQVLHWFIKLGKAFLDVKACKIVRLISIFVDQADHSLPRCQGP